jgi:hypothetical protein
MVGYSQYLDKRLFVQLNGSRKVLGVLRGYDVSIHGQKVICSPDQKLIQVRDLGLSQYCSRRRGRGEGWRGKGQTWDGSMYMIRISIPETVSKDTADVDLRSFVETQ